MPKSLYQKYKKEKGLTDVPFEREISEFVNSLLEFADKNGSKEMVTKEKDWDVIAFICKGFYVLYPKTAAEFEKNVRALRANQKSSHASIKDRGGAQAQHMLKVPSPLFRMIQVIFPLQKWDRRFVLKFAQRFPKFKVTHDSL